MFGLTYLKLDLLGNKLGQDQKAIKLLGNSLKYLHNLQYLILNISYNNLIEN